VTGKLEVMHKYLGLTVKPLSQEEAMQLGTNGGLLITMSTTKAQPAKPAWRRT